MTKFDHYETMKFSLNNRVFTIMLNAPEKLNAFSEEMEPELCKFLGDGVIDQDFDIVVLTGAGRAALGLAIGI